VSSQLAVASGFQFKADFSKPDLIPLGPTSGRAAPLVAHSLRCRRAPRDLCFKPFL